MPLTRTRGLRALALSKTTALIAVATLLLSGLAVVPAAAQEPVPMSAEMAASTTAGSAVRTATATGFQPGNIISNAVFFNRGSMTAAQIQSFLQAKVPACQAGYTCLRDKYDTSRTTTADAMCGAYAGAANERASTIIYKVAQACGINPQVLLVTLEKEQGLVTHTWPSDWRYTIAMGQGCPDTAACDTRYYGFFNQVYGAAWQLKRYANPAGTSKFFTWYAPGNTWNVRYNPNAACGSSPVYIQNQATANLYYYTPYQPNAAALRAGNGTGDSCSAYGNRNFYNRFTEWFGSTQRNVDSEIESEYQAQGGEAVLGVPIGPVTQLFKNGGGYGRAYANGSIYWSYGYGAKTMRAGPLRDYYFARGGADGTMGWPTLNQQTLTLPTGNGIGQVFTSGSLYSGSAGTFLVREPIRSRYFTFNGAAGALGWPTTDQSCANGICRQNFGGGAIVSSSAGTFALQEPVRAAYDAAGGVTGSWGVPTSGVLAVKGGGAGQVFARGSAYYRSGGQAFFVTGGIRDKYFALGGATGQLGFPVGAMKCASASVCNQQFQYGWLLWTSTGGARVGDPAIDAAYASVGGSGGALGARTGPFVYYAYNGGGFAEGFKNGAIFYKPSRGAFAVWGAIRTVYFNAGGAAGALGWPTSGVSCANGTCAQKFEGATIVSSSAGTYAVQEPVRTAYGAAGGVTGSWGVPTSGVLAVKGGGAGQVFATGSAYYRSGGQAFFVTGGIRDTYFALGGATGRLGFPVGAMTCANSACQQQFQYGWLLWTAAGGTRVGDPAIDRAYASVGGAGGALGARTTGSFVHYSYNGGGFAEGFKNGAIFYKPSRGAFAVWGAIRTAYFNAGGASGRYGWPTSAMTCANGTCTQKFEGGTISAAG